MAKKPMTNIPVQTAGQSGAKAFQAATKNSGALPGNSFMNQATGKQRFPGRKSVGMKPTQKSTQTPELSQRINAPVLSQARVEGYRNRIQTLSQQADDKQILGEYETILKEAQGHQDSFAEETMRNDMQQFLTDSNELRQGMRAQ
mgnify:CR=1 FL=1|tara:strand:- start:16206 stop:16640 length:435 start_codon:yes stop_codon:yes gene_type:complete